MQRLTALILLLTLLAGATLAQDWRVRWAYETTDLDLNQAVVWTEGSPAEATQTLLVSGRAGTSINSVLMFSPTGVLLDNFPLAQGYYCDPGIVVEDNKLYLQDAVNSSYKGNSSVELTRLQGFNRIEAFPEPVMQTGHDTRLYNSNSRFLRSTYDDDGKLHLYGFGSARSAYYSTGYYTTHFDADGGVVAVWQWNVESGEGRMVEMLPASNNRVYAFASYFDYWGDYNDVVFARCHHSNGALVWTRELPEVGGIYSRYARAMALVDEGLILSCSAYSTVSTLTLLNYNSVVEWDRIIDIPRPRAMVALDDGSLVLAAGDDSTDPPIFLYHISRTGTIYQISDPINMGYVDDFREGPDGSLVLVGSYWSGNNELTSVVAVLDKPEPVVNVDDPGGTQSRTLPTRFQLHPIYPNPFNRRATVTLDLPSASPLTVTVYDLLGRPVRILHDGPAPPGQHRLVMDAHGLSTGSYLLRAETEDEQQVRRMLFLK